MWCRVLFPFFVSIETYFVSKYVINAGESSMACWEEDIQFCATFCKYSLGPFDLGHCLTTVFLCPVLFWMTSQFTRKGYWSHPGLLREVQILILAVIRFLLWTWLPCALDINVLELQYLLGRLLSLMHMECPFLVGASPGSDQVPDRRLGVDEGRTIQNNTESKINEIKENDWNTG